MHAAANDNDNDSVFERYNPIGIYGWRKRCLYFLILSLIVVIIVNMALTVWILVVMDFSVHGMGNLRFTDGGIRVEGKAEFLRPLYAREISSDAGSSLSIKSQKAVNIAAGQSHFNLGADTLSIKADAVEVRTQSTASADPLLSLTEEKMVVTASQLHASGALGVVLDGPLTTSQIQSPPNQALNIIGPSGKIYLNGTRGLQLQAGFLGEIAITSAKDITIRGSEITINSASVKMAGLPISTPTGQGTMWPDTFQVCACPVSYKLFLVPSNVTDCGFSLNAAICNT